MNLSNSYQLEKIARETAALLTKKMSVTQDYTQPFTNEAPSFPLKESVALASAFSTSLGSSEFNTSALSSVASQLVGSFFGGQGSGFVSALPSSTNLSPVKVD